MVNIFVAMPSASWFPRPETMLNVCQQELPEWVNLIFTKDSIIKRMPIQYARNELLKRFLQYKFDYIWFIDDDNPPSIDVLKYLLSHKEKENSIISWIVPLRSRNWYNIFKNNKEIENIETKDPLIEVDEIGTACCLIPRDLAYDVYEDEKWFPFQFVVSDFVYNKKKKMVELYKNQDKKEDWKEKYIKDNKNPKKIQKKSWMVSEDIYFCRQVKRLWYKIYADIRARCYHFTNEDTNKRVNPLDFKIK